MNVNIVTKAIGSVTTTFFFMFLGQKFYQYKKWSMCVDNNVVNMLYYHNEKKKKIQLLQSSKNILETLKPMSNHYNDCYYQGRFFKHI